MAALRGLAAMVYPQRLWLISFNFSALYVGSFVVNVSLICAIIRLRKIYVLRGIFNDYHVSACVG